MVAITAAAGGGVGSYVALRVQLATMKVEQQYARRDIDLMAGRLDTMEQRIGSAHRRIDRHYEHFHKGEDTAKGDDNG